MRGLLPLSAGIDWLSEHVGKAVSWLIFLAVVISAGNAIVRKVFSISSNAWLEAQWYLYGAAFLGAAAYTLKENEHIRIDVIYGRWSRRTQHWIDLIGHTLFLLPFTVLMVYFFIPWLRLSYTSGEISSNAGGLILWPAKLCLTVGFILLMLQAISEIIKKIAVMRGILPDDHNHETTADIVTAEATGAAHDDHHIAPRKEV